MKKSKTKIEVKLKDCLNCPLLGGWDYICNKYGFNPWMFNEGLADENSTTKITVEDAEYIGILKD